MGEVHSFESTLEQRLKKSKDELTKEVLADSRNQVREVIGGFSTQLEGLVQGQMESVRQSTMGSGAFSPSQNVSASYFEESKPSVATSQADGLVLQKLEDIATLLRGLKAKGEV